MNGVKIKVFNNTYDSVIFDVFFQWINYSKTLDSCFIQNTVLFKEGVIL
jgi:hypothetical protein